MVGDQEIRATKVTIFIKPGDFVRASIEVLVDELDIEALESKSDILVLQYP
jgi:hypothetical protein